MPNLDSDNAHAAQGSITGPSGMLAHYSLQLWGRNFPAIAEVKAQIESALGPEFEPAEQHESQLSYRSLAAAPDGGPPPEWTIDLDSFANLSMEARADVEQALMQSWWFREAAEIAGTCTHRLTLTDHLHTGLDYRQRLHDMQRLLAAVIEAVGGEAVWWRPSQQFLHPRAVLESFHEDQFKNPLPGGLNVRYYDVPAEDSEDGSFKLMDTLGLGALGLTDLEIRYRGLDPEAVSQVLFNTALYVYSSGPVLRDGETIQGPGPNDRWLLTRATSLSEPEREVWSIDPGAPFAVEL